MDQRVPVAVKLDTLLLGGTGVWYGFSDTKILAGGT